MLIITSEEHAQKLNNELEVLRERISHLEKENACIVDMVRRMRGFQNEWQRYHASSDREKMRLWQRKVDGFIKDKMREQGQGKLI